MPNGSSPVANPSPSPVEVVEQLREFSHQVEFNDLTGHAILEARDRLAPLLDGLPEIIERDGEDPIQRSELLKELTWWSELVEERWQEMVALVKTAHEKRGDPERFQMEPTRIHKLEHDLVQGDLIVNKFGDWRLFIGLKRRDIDKIREFIYPNSQTDTWGNIHFPEEYASVAGFKTFEVRRGKAVAQPNNIVFLSGETYGYYVKEPGEVAFWKAFFQYFEDATGVAFDWDTAFKRLEQVIATGVTPSRFKSAEHPRDSEYCIVVDPSTIPIS